MFCPHAQQGVSNTQSAFYGIGVKTKLQVQRTKCGSTSLWIVHFGNLNLFNLIKGLMLK